MQKVALFLFCAFLSITAAAPTAQFQYSGNLSLGYDEEHISSLSSNDNLACGDVAVSGYFATHFGAVNVAAHPDACGRCITFECLKPEDCRDSPMTKVTVQIIDSCASCDSTTLVSNSYSVRELVGSRVEAVDVRWSFVNCSSREPTASVPVAGINVDAVVKTGNEIIGVAQLPVAENLVETSFVPESEEERVEEASAENQTTRLDLMNIDNLLTLSAPADEIVPIGGGGVGDASSVLVDPPASEVADSAPLSLTLLSPMPSEELNVSTLDVVMISGPRILAAPVVEISGVRQPALAVEISGVRGRK